MTQYQLYPMTVRACNACFNGDGQLGRLLEVVLDQVLNDQVGEQFHGYRNGYKLCQLTSRVGALTLRFPSARRGVLGGDLVL